jgi:hypothetical protein
VVDFEDAEGRVWVAVGEGVKSGTEDDILADAQRHRAREKFLCVTAASHEKRAK